MPNKVEAARDAAWQKDKRKYRYDDTVTEPTIAMPVYYDAFKAGYDARGSQWVAVSNTIHCPQKESEEVWLEFGWLEANGNRNMLWYNEGNSDEFQHWYRALNTKRLTDEPKGRMYFRMLIRPDCDMQIVCEPYTADSGQEGE